MLIALVLLAVSPLTILDNGVARTIDCGGREIVVAGNRSQLTLTGDCPVVSVNGNHNQITISNAASIEIAGNENQVTWGAAVSGSAPAIANAGRSNSITQGKSLSVSTGREDAVTIDQDGVRTGAITIGHGGIDLGDTAAAGATKVKVNVISITGASQKKTIDCAGGSVTVSGAKNQLTLVGKCEEVTISGAMNHVTIQSAARINVPGAKNVVTWPAAASPRVSATGVGNDVHAN